MKLDGRTASSPGFNCLMPQPTRLRGISRPDAGIFHFPHTCPPRVFFTQINACSKSKPRTMDEADGRMKLECSQKTCDRGKHFLDYCKLQEFSPCTNHCSINSLVTYLLVAPIMKTFFLAFIPSISVNT
jgi:hypothetical protein